MLPLMKKVGFWSIDRGVSFPGSLAGLVEPEVGHGGRLKRIVGLLGIQGVVAGLRGS